MEKRHPRRDFGSRRYGRKERAESHRGNPLADGRVTGARLRGVCGVLDRPIWRRSMTNFRRGGIALALAGGLIAGPAFAAPTVLRASHQFPGGKGDARDEMVQIIARDAKAANVGLDVQVYPGASLFKPNEQWNALSIGQLDISSFPLLCQRQGARLRRNAHAWTGAQSRTCATAQHLAIH